MRGGWLSGAGLVLLLAAAFTASAAPAAEPVDGPGAGAFLKLEGTNGYSLLVFAGSRRADGRGRVAILAASRRGYASYESAATVTTSKLEADLGALGEIDLEYVPTGITKTVECERKKFTIPGGQYTGRFGFHGEEGFTSAEETVIPARDDLSIRLLCGDPAGYLDAAGFGLPGARLNVRSRKGASHSIDLEVKKNSPKAKTKVSVRVREERSGIRIERGVEYLTTSAGFRYDERLRTATVDPPAPFEGSATYRRQAGPANRWRGDLTVDLPGRSDVPLARPGLRTSLVHAEWHGWGERLGGLAP